MPQKRKFHKGVYDLNTNSPRFYEKLSLIAFEGSSLTLLGTLQYDAALNKGQGGFKMTDVGAIVAGGAKETLRYLIDQVQQWSTMKNVFIFFTGLFAALTVFSVYQRFQAYKVKAIRDKQLEQAKEAIKDIQPMPEN